MATIYDVAKLAGVSKSTVSRAFNPDKSIKSVTKKKVMAAAKTLGYSPTIGARGLAMNKKFVIGLFMTRLHEDASTYFSTIISAANEKLPNDYLLSIISMDQVEDDPQIIKNRFDGAIFFSQSEADDHFIDQLLDNNIPTTVVLRKVLKKVDNVYADENNAMQQLIDFANKNHHQRLGFINGSSNFTSSKIRYKSVNTHAGKLGLSLTPDSIKQGEFSLKSGEKLMREILNIPATRRPTCIICASDDIALGAIKACRDAGVKVPEDVSITGYDNIPYAEISSPPLTTIAHPLKAMAEIGMDFLLNRIQDSKVDLQTAMIKPTFVQRKSVINKNNSTKSHKI